MMHTKMLEIQQYRLNKISCQIIENWRLLFQVATSSLAKFQVRINYIHVTKVAHLSPHMMRRFRQDQIWVALEIKWELLIRVKAKDMGVQHQIKNKIALDQIANHGSSRDMETNFKLQHTKLLSKIRHRLQVLCHTLRIQTK